MRTRTRRAAAAVIMMCVFILLTGMTVKSQAKEAVSIDTEYYELLEDEYLDQVREVLRKEGYSNCGLTLTYTRDAEGIRTYDLSVYHRRFSNLDSEAKTEMLHKLEMISFVEKVEPAFLEM